MGFTEKVDGTNIRVIFKDFIDGVHDLPGGAPKTRRFHAIGDATERAVFADGGKAVAEVFPTVLPLYGEGYGAKIQKGGGNYQQDQDFVLFDVKCMTGCCNADVEDAWLGIDVVPIIGGGALHDAVARARAGILSTWGDFKRKDRSAPKN